MGNTERLSPNALFEVASTIEKDKADVVYTGAAFGLANLQAVPYD